MDGYDMGSGGWIVVILFWAVLIGVIVWAVVRISPNRSGSSQPTPAEQPRDILDRRLARGEIDTDTYDRLRAKLSEDKASGRTT